MRLAGIASKGGWLAIVNHAGLCQRLDTFRKSAATGQSLMDKFTSIVNLSIGVCAMTKLKKNNTFSN